MSDISASMQATKDELNSVKFLVMLMLKSPDFSYAMLLKYFLLNLYDKMVSTELDPKTLAETLKIYGECLETLRKIKTEETTEFLAELDKMYYSATSASSALDKVLDRERT